MKWNSVLCIFTALFVIAISPGTQGQDTQARIVGSVTDKHGTAVSGAKIKIIPRCKCSDCESPERCECCPGQVTTTTDQEGHFEVKVKSGSYDLETLGQKAKVTVRPREDKSVVIVVPRGHNDLNPVRLFVEVCCNAAF